MTIPLSWLVGGATGAALVAALADDTGTPAPPSRAERPAGTKLIPLAPLGVTADAMVAKVLAKGGRFKWDAAKTTGDRFSDARYFCFGLSGGVPYSIDADLGARWGTASTGHEYLHGTPATSRERINLLRQRVTSWPRRAEPRSGVGVLREVSTEALYKISVGVYQAAKSEVGVAHFASLLGVDTAKVRRDLGSLAKVIETSVGDAASEAAQVVVRQAFDLIAPYLLAQVKAAASAIGMGADALSNMASAVPFVGQVAGVILEMNASLLQARRLLWAESCKGYYSVEIQPWIGKTVRRGYPLPWHLPDQISFGCPEDPHGSLAAASRWVPGQLTAIAETYRQNYAYFAALPISAQVDIAKWWSLSLTLMSVPEVGSVFDALGWGAVGGSLWASDEQVLLVAAPIAVAHGLPVYAFAEALHRLSGGHLDRPESERIPQERSIPVYACPEKYWYDPTTWGAHGCDIVGVDTICGRRAANAYHLNLAELTRNAFEIAAEVVPRPR